MVVFLGGTVVKNLPANVGDMGLIPGSGTFPGEGIGYPLQYSGLVNPMDRGYTPWGCNRVRYNSSAKSTTSTYFVVVSFFVQNTYWSFLPSLSMQPLWKKKYIYILPHTDFWLGKWLTCQMGCNFKRYHIVCHFYVSFDFKISKALDRS